MAAAARGVVRGGERRPRPAGGRSSSCRPAFPPSLSSSLSPSGPPRSVRGSPAASSALSPPVGFLQRPGPSAPLRLAGLLLDPEPSWLSLPCRARPCALQKPAHPPRGGHSPEIPLDVFSLHLGKKECVPLLHQGGSVSCGCHPPSPTSTKKTHTLTAVMD